MYSSEYKELEWGSYREQILIIALSIGAGLIAKFPDFAGIDQDLYFQRNISFVFFPMLSLYFIIKNRVSLLKSAGVFAIIVLSAVYINLLPGNGSSDNVVLASIHMPFFMWTIAGYCYIGCDIKNIAGRIEFLRFNGELAVITSFILIAGAALSAVTIVLFELINIRIEDFYFGNIAIWGFAASPIIGTYLVKKNMQLVKNVPVIIAKIFTPLLLIMLIVYLAAIAISAKNPYNDREFLLIFNLLLIGVMAVILFSLTGPVKNTQNKAALIVLTALSAVTIIVNMVALSAIVFRIFEGGITPNRIAVLGTNLLILVNLIIVTIRLVQSAKNPAKRAETENSIALFLPFYAFWAAVVIFIFPLLFR